MVAAATLPNVASRLTDAAGIITREWRDFLLKLATETDNAALAAQLTALALRVSALEDEEVIFSLMGLGSVLVIGPLVGNAYRIELQGDADAPGPTWYYGTGPDGVKGFFRLADALSAGIGLVKTESGYVVLGEVDAVADLPGSGSVGEAYRVLDPAGLYAWDGAAWTLDAAATGEVGFRLAELADTGIGAALVKITRDAYGRVEGTESATTDDLTEGATNLYFTDARADARITLQKGQPLGLATLDAGGKLDAGQLPALAITETFVVASQAAMLALTAQEGDVAVRTDLNKSFILTAAPASTLSNWQELLTPMSPVTSVFGRAGSVAAASGDYMVAQVTGAAPLASPVFTGNPTAPTPATADNDTSVATTAFVKAQGYALDSGVIHTTGNESAAGIKKFLDVLWAGDSPNGSVQLNRGSTTRTGYASFFSGDGTTRIGYIGFGSATQLQIFSESGVSYDFNANPTVAGAQVWNATNLADSGWGALTLTNSWTNYGGSYGTAAARKFGGIIYLRGLITGGAAANGTSVATLPSGYRPTADAVFPISNGNSPTNDTRIIIRSSGQIQVYGPVDPASTVNLDGIVFWAT